MNVTKTLNTLNKNNKIISIIIEILKTTLQHQVFIYKSERASEQRISLCVVQKSQAFLFIKGYNFRLELKF